MINFDLRQISVFLFARFEFGISRFFLEFCPIFFCKQFLVKNFNQHAATTNWFKNLYNQR